MAGATPCYRSKLALKDFERSLGSGRKLVVALGLGYAVLPNFVEQGLVANLEDGRRLLAIPVGLFESFGNGLRFGFILRRPSQGFQPTWVGPLA